MKVDILEKVFGRIEECWDCGKEFRSRYHHYKLSNENVVPLCNFCVFHRDINKIRKMEE